MNLPKKLRILGQTWSVEICDIHEKLEELNPSMIDDLNESGNSVLGFCSQQLRLICIEENMALGAQVEILVHEATHAYNSVMPGNFTEEQDEDIARMFSAYVLDLFLNNKMDWIKAE